MYRIFIELPNYTLSSSKELVRIGNHIVVGVKWQNVHTTAKAGNDQEALRQGEEIS